MSLTTILTEVVEEIRRAGDKFGPQTDLPDGTRNEWIASANRARHYCQRAFEKGEGTWRLVLEEEVCEAFGETDPARLREELLQVAAVALRWVNAIDERSTT